MLKKTTMEEERKRLNAMQDVQVLNKVEDYIASIEKTLRNSMAPSTRPGKICAL